MNKLLIILFFLLSASTTSALPANFVYLKDVDPSIIQEIRYAGNHNFIGRPIVGYQSATCILTIPAANALKQVQDELRKQGLTLKVYDCYRPIAAVHDFISWSKSPFDEKMKSEFYPRVDKKDFFILGYVAESSGHSRGSTVDLTVVNLSKLQQPPYTAGQKLKICYGPANQRFQDNSIDMGTGFDCMDPCAQLNTNEIGVTAQQNRSRLQTIMIKYGFTPYDKEWWHFTLTNEPYKNNYFNFPVKG